MRNFSAKMVFHVILLVPLLCIPAEGRDFSIESLEKELSIIKARLLAGPQGALFLDKGGKDKVEKGDLFTVYSRGRQVEDPESGEALGTFSEPAALCRVKRSGPDLSEVSVKLLKKGFKVKPGMEAYRFKEVPACFLDRTGNAGFLYRILRSGLSSLDWQERTKSGGTQDSLEEASLYAVFFEAYQGALALWSGGEVRAVYQGLAFSGRADAAGPNERKTADNRKHSTPLKMSSESGAFDEPVPGITSEIKMPRPGVFASIDCVVDNFRIMNPPGCKKTFLVFLCGREISARAVNGEKSFEYSYEGFGEAVNLDSNGSGLVALNIHEHGKGMRSRVLRLTDSGFVTAARDIDYILAFADQPDTSPCLLGQRFSESELLLPVVHRLCIEGEKARKKGPVEVPPGYSLFGAFHADMDGDGSDDTGFFNPGGRLVVYGTSEKGWQSAESFSGSLNTLLVEDPCSRDTAPSELTIWSRPAVFSYKGSAYAAFALNRSGLSSAVGGGPHKGTVGVLDCGKNSCRLRLVQESFSGPIQDVAVYRDQLLVCVIESGFLRGKGRSHILSLPLQMLVSS